MKQLKLLSLLFMLSLFLQKGFSQTGADCSQAIDVSYAISPASPQPTFTNSIPYQSFIWYKFVANSNSIEIEVRNLGMYQTRIDELTLYADCINPSYLIKDSITLSSDTVLHISYSSLTIGDTYYIKVGGDNFVACDCSKLTSIPYEFEYKVNWDARQVQAFHAQPAPPTRRFNVI